MSILTEIREKAEARARYLKEQIRGAREEVTVCEGLLAEAKNTLQGFERELAPLLAILNPAGGPPTGTAEAMATAVEVAPASDRPVVYSSARELPITVTVTAPKVTAPVTVRRFRTRPAKSWNRYKLPPRVRKFLFTFGVVGVQVTGQQIRDWYKSVHPNIQKNSLAQAVFDLTGILIRKGIMARVDRGLYEFKDPADNQTPQNIPTA
jgi:hypothetical protein